MNVDLGSYQGVITASTGNHGQAVANISNQIKIKCWIVVPCDTPKNKIEKIKKENAIIILDDTLMHYEDCVAYAKELSHKENLLYIPSFDDEDIIAGHQSLFEEVAEEQINFDKVFCQIGGGGLISAAVKSRCFKSENIFGVELEGAASMKESLDMGSLVAVNIDKKSASFCEGVLVDQVGNIPFKILKRKHVIVETVSEEDVKNAIIFLSRHGIVSEGAGAVGVAKYLKSNLRNKTVLCIISGENIDKDIWEKLVK